MVHSAKASFVFLALRVNRLATLLFERWTALKKNQTCIYPKHNNKKNPQFNVLYFIIIIAKSFSSQV